MAFAKTDRRRLLLTPKIRSGGGPRSPRTSQRFRWVGVETQPGDGAQVSAHASVCQGKPFWVRLLDPRPGRESDGILGFLLMPSCAERPGSTFSKSGSPGPRGLTPSTLRRHSHFQAQHLGAETTAASLGYVMHVGVDPYSLPPVLTIGPR